jgi:hypothetical protein
MAGKPDKPKADGPDPLSHERALDPEGYWTPERLRHAKPLELPTVPSPPSSKESEEPPQGPSENGVSKTVED